jgi:UDPglucose 6-dehydrogenase
VEKSTVPVQTSDLISKILQYKNDNDVEFSILSNPEFLAEGTAVKDLTTPDRILIGGESQEALKVLVDIYAKWIPRHRILLTTVWSSELSKLVANALLAQRVSSMNAVSALCEKVGANVYEISGACGKDSRIGSKFLLPSVGFGGSCFQKDILNLCYLCEIHGLPEVSAYFHQIILMNNFQRTRFANKIIQGMFGTLHSKKLVFMGFAFKKDTSDTRESSPIYVGKNLLEEKANLIIHDPKVHEEQIFSDLSRIMANEYESESYQPTKKESLTEIKKHVSIDRDIYSAVKGADALIIFTEWDCFKDYDYEKIFSLMEKPAFVFDGRNLLDHTNLKKIGFETWLIGVDK